MTANTPRLAHAHAKWVLHYDPRTGIFYWTDPTYPRHKVGDRADREAAHGYRRVSIERERILAHRLAWFWMSGSWPDVQIDHANGDRSDNRWANLRLATQRQNNANSRVRRNSKTGLRGVHLHETGLYRAYISKPGKSITHLGYFKTPEEAYAAYCQAAHETYGEFARSAPSKPDGWASYDIAIAAKREQLVRSGRERPVSEAEARWAEEGERPTRELETWKRRLA